jgi:hypothetical protein
MAVKKELKYIGVYTCTGMTNYDQQNGNASEPIQGRQIRAFEQVRDFRDIGEIPGVKLFKHLRDNGIYRI